MKTAFAAIGVLLALTGMARATQVWSAGPGDITFSKAPGTDPTLAGDQDRITANDWITRGTTQGLINAKTETSYTHSSSPADTEWAFSSLNNPAFAYGAGAAEHASLTFAPFETALGGAGVLETNILSEPGVLHLMSSDIYIDIEFSVYANGHSGPDGSFTYERAVAAVPEGGTLGLLAAGAGLMLRRRRALR